jgi:predicted HTH transcriptional regulator
MKQGVSKIRNHVIARIFRELGLIEQWGSGIPRIFREAKQQQLKELQIIEMGMRMRVIIPLKEQIISQVTPQVTPQVTLPIKRLLKIIQGEMSRLEMQSALGLKDRENFRKEYLLVALDLARREMTIPDKPKSRLQRYRLTEKGHACLKQIIGDL